MDNNNTETLTQATFQGYLNRFCGTDKFGEAKAVGSYQFFAAEEDDDSKNKQTLYKISKATYTLHHNRANPNFIQMDIKFNAYDDTELKLLWSRLKKMEDSVRREPDKMWIFNFTLVEMESISEDEDSNDTLLIAHLVNPVMSYLTRETPTDLSEEKLYQGELVGGNVVRLLFTPEYVSLEESNNYDTPELKAESYRDEYAKEYVDNYVPPVDDGKIW